MPHRAAGVRCDERAQQRQAQAVCGAAGVRGFPARAPAQRRRITLISRVEQPLDFLRPNRYRKPRRVCVKRR